MYPTTTYPWWRIGYTWRNRVHTRAGYARVRFSRVCWSARSLACHRPQQRVYISLVAAGGFARENSVAPRFPGFSSPPVLVLLSRGDCQPSFLVLFFLLPLLLLLLQPCRNPSQGNHALRRSARGGDRGKSIGAFWRYANAAGYSPSGTRLCYRDSNMLIDRRDGYLYGMNEGEGEGLFDR